MIGLLSFLLWYRPIYLGFRKPEGKAMAFFIYTFFLFAGFHLLFSVYMAIGIPCERHPRISRQQSARWPG